MPDSPYTSVVGIDTLVALMCVSSAAHAARHRQLELLLASTALGLGTEFASIRFGGTHCHNYGAVNFAQCSSANAVFYYGPWIYSCVLSALKLVGEGGDAANRWALPWLCGALTFGMCGVYEMQGPNMRWWKWPRPETGHIVDFDGAPFWQLHPTGSSLVISSHAGAALKERVFDLHDDAAPGLPVMAPYFDMAFGWGVGAMLWAAPGLGTSACVLIGPLIALLWDLPVRALENSVGVDKTASVPMLMAAAVLIPLLFMRGGVARQPSTAEPDWLLFSIPAANQVFFVHNAIATSSEIIPPTLKVLVVGVAGFSLLAHALAAGLIGTTDATAARAAPKRSRSVSPTARPPKAAGGGRSLLDRLQKDAQENELEPANTAPGIFLLLVVAQTVAVAALCHYALPPRFHTAAQYSIGSHWVGFVISVLINSDKWFDVTEDIAYLGILIWAYQSIDGPPSPRQQLVFGLAFLWILRLLAFLGYRVVVRGRDFRFDKLIAEPCYNLFGWTSGGTWCFLNGFCLWHLAGVAGASAKLDWLDWLGAAIFCAGFATEIIADLQKYAFNASYASGANKKWISSGLWGVSRHPNYCGEISLWLGLSLACMGGARAAAASAGTAALCLVTPIWSCFFLFFTSLMLLEKRSDIKWGRIKAYQAYKEATPVLFPFLS